LSSRSRKSRRGCETTLPGSHLPRRPTDTPRRHSTSTLDQPTPDAPPLFPLILLPVVAPRCPPPTPPTLGINENDVTAKSPAFNYQSYAPRAARPARARARAHACSSVRAYVRAYALAAAATTTTIVDDDEESRRASSSSWNWHVTRTTGRGSGAIAHSAVRLSVKRVRGTIDRDLG
jgi:hypothetical protein